MKKYLKLMRIQHYLKNGLIFLPIVFSAQLFELDLLIQTVLGFISFCLISSVVYIINDIQDVGKDRLHPKKSKRPIASGEISKKNALILAFVLFITSVIVSKLASNTDNISLTLLLIYFGLNIAYSFGLKNIPIIDVVILVAGFLLRVLYGSAIIDVGVSNWLYLTVMSMAFYLGFGKRRNEVIIQGNTTRGVLKYYNHEFLDKNMYVCLGLTIVFYALWCVDPNTVMNHSNANIVWTVPLVMMICMKYSLTIEGESSGDPIDVVLGDKMLMILVIVYAIITFFIVYNPIY